MQTCLHTILSCLIRALQRDAVLVWLNTTSKLLAEDLWSTTLKPSKQVFSTREKRSKQCMKMHVCQDLRRLLFFSHLDTK
jgi:hypothetical protein